MADSMDVIIWALMFIPILLLLLSLYSHPALVITEINISNDPITQQDSSNESVRDLKSVLSSKEWSEYKNTKEEIVKINYKTEKDIHVCGKNSTNGVGYPSPDSVILYDKLDDRQKKILSDLVSEDAEIKRKWYDPEESKILSFQVFPYPSYSDQVYEINGEEYTYDEVKPFFQKSAVLNQDCVFYEINENHEEIGSLGYLVNTDYTLLLLFSLGFLMDYLNTVLKRNRRYSDNKENRD
jgi:hypothetical protein